ncbi:hypothetical protein BD289DRAFT_454891 [Coniella lustricola]|uniref:DUF6604 domain-containing protein n=1 Tax=Coniella lustricola TaxID=2025994 RepID=A0A2T3A1V1_9PEZI|nr:hypothetical protein BD289DRAFT_454891 [Coniella lustricola]
MAGSLNNRQGFIIAYKQYKEDTAAILGWLLSNALKHGFKCADAELSLIRSHELVPMAQRIVAGHEKGTFVIHAVLNSKFRRAIAARKQHTAWYTTFTKGQDKSNEAHTYFTEILLQTWNVLLDASSATTTTVTTTTATATGVSMSRRTSSVTPNPASGNRFRPLTLDDISLDDPEDDPQPKCEAEPVGKHEKKTKIKNKKRRYKKPKPKDAFRISYAALVANEEQLEDDFWFAISCFVREQFRIRDIVKGYWKAYAEGQLELEVASIGTHLAIDLVRRSEAELAVTVTYPARFPEKDWPVWKLPLLLLSQHLREGRFAGLLQLEEAWDTQDDYLMQTLQFYAVWSLLFTCRNVSDAWVDEIDGLIGPDFNIDGEFQFMRNLFDAQFGLSRNLRNRAPLTDEISRAMLQVKIAADISLWATFACRILLDMHSILPHRRGAMFRPTQPAAEVEEQFRALLKATHLTDIGKSVQGTYGRGYLGYHDSPLWSATYFYLAGRILFPESMAWPDMEYLLQRYGERILAGSRRAPETLSELGNMCLSMGCQATRGKRHCRGSEDIHTDLDCSQLGKYHCRRLYSCYSHATEERDNFKDMIRDMYGKPALSRLAKQLGMDPEHSEQGRDFVNNWAGRLQTWTPEAVLELTQLYASVDMADVCFDWETLDQTCEKLCNKMTEALRANCCGFHRNIESTFYQHEYLPDLLVRLTSAARELGPPSSARRNDEYSSRLMEKLNKKVPWFAAFWAEVQGYCTQQTKVPGCDRDDNEMHAFVGERGIAALFYFDSHQSVARNPSKLVIRQYKACFRGWPDQLFEQSTSKKLADKIMTLVNEPASDENKKKNATSPENPSSWNPTYKDKLDISWAWRKNFSNYRRPADDEAFLRETESIFFSVWEMFAESIANHQ